MPTWQLFLSHPTSNLSGNPIGSIFRICPESSHSLLTVTLATTLFLPTIISCLDYCVGSKQASCSALGPSHVACSIVVGMILWVYVSYNITPEPSRLYRSRSSSGSEEKAESTWWPRWLYMTRPSIFFSHLLFLSFFIHSAFFLFFDRTHTVHILILLQDFPLSASSAWDSQSRHQPGSLLYLLSSLKWHNEVFADYRI